MFWQVSVGEVLDVRTTRPISEPLERRRLFAAGIFINPSGLLTAQGSEGDDTISLERVGIDDVIVRIEENGTGQSISARHDMDDFDGVLLRGFGGNDTITDVDALPEDVFIAGDAGNDTLRAPDFGGGSIFDRIDLTGGEGDDVIHGGNSFNVIDAGGGNDTVFGGDGGDWLTGGDGRDVIRGEGGPDRIFDGHNIDDDADALFGGAGSDTIHASGGNDYLEGNDGHDSLNGGDQHDTLLGGNGDDILDGSNGTDSLDGGAGHTAFLRGETGFTEPTSPAVVIGATNTLVVVGTSGADTITIARTGFDDLRITVNSFVAVIDMDDFGPLLVVGHRGNDSVTVNEDVPRGAVTLDGGNGNDTLTGGGNDDLLVGGSGRDSLFGRGGDDTLRAVDSEADTLFGGAGDDEAFVDAIDQTDGVEDVTIFT